MAMASAQREPASTQPRTRTPQTPLSSAASVVDMTWQLQELTYREHHGQRDAQSVVSLVAQLADGEPDFSLEDVRCNVKYAVEEYRRLRMVTKRVGVFEEVEVDLDANHIRWVDLHDRPLPGGIGIEEGPEFQEALFSMPGLFDQTGRTPLWQVLVSKRKVILQVHHVLMDGIGLAGAASCLLCLISFEQYRAIAAQTFAAIRRKSKPRVSPFWAVIETIGWYVKALLHLHWYCIEGIIRLLKPLKGTAISAPACTRDSQAPRWLHIGPYPLADIKQHAKSREMSVNELLAQMLVAGVRDYADPQDFATRPLAMVMPVTMKGSESEDSEALVRNDTTLVVVNYQVSPMTGSFLETLELGPPMWAKIGISMMIHNLVGMIPNFLSCPLTILAQQAASFLAEDVVYSDLCFTNVNGSLIPNEYVSLATGAKRRIVVHSYTALPRVSIGNGLVVAAVSHGDVMQMSFVVDHVCVKHPEAFVMAMHKQFLAFTHLQGSAQPRVRA